MHLAHSMQSSGSQIGISSAMERFSYCVVSVGNVPSMGRAETGRRSPSPARMRDVTRSTKSGTCAGTGGRRWIAEVTPGISSCTRPATAASTARSLRSTTTSPKRPYDLEMAALM